MGSKRLRLGLVGAGPWGRNYVRTIVGLDGVELARVASRNPQTKSITPPGCAVSTDWRDLIEARDLHGILIATPPATHAEVVVACIEAGRPVLVEKPLAVTTASADLIVAAAAGASALVMVDHTHLFHPAYRALKRMALEQGPIRGIRSSAGNHGPYRSEVPVLWDWGPHDIAMCIDLFGAEPTEVHAYQLDARPISEGLAERLQVELFFAGGVLAELRLSTLDDRVRRFAVALDAATIVYDGLATSSLMRYPAPKRDGPGGKGEAIPVANELPLTRAVLDFVAAIAEGSTSLASVELGASVVRTLARCDAVLAQESASRHCGDD
jgi:predicted dehydrogenase